MCNGRTLCSTSNVTFVTYHVCNINLRHDSVKIYPGNKISSTLIWYTIMQTISTDINVARLSSSRCLLWNVQHRFIYDLLHIALTLLRDHVFLASSACLHALYIVHEHHSSPFNTTRGSNFYYIPRTCESSTRLAFQYYLPTDHTHSSP